MPGKEIKGRSKIAKYNKGGRVKANQGGYVGSYIKRTRRLFKDT